MPRSARPPLIVAVAVWAAPVAAHGGEQHDAWSYEPLAFGLLLLSISLYAIGFVRMNVRQREAIAPHRRVLAYSGSVVAIVVALFSPIDALAGASFAWHMVQHLLLMLVAAPLLAMGNAHLVALLAFPLRPRRQIGRMVRGAPGVRSGASSPFAPPLAGLAFAAGLWLWHAPRMYDAALADPTLHTLEHLTFLLTSTIFWRMISMAGDRRLNGMSALVLVAMVCLQGNLLAALLTLAPQPLYSPYTDNPLSDQQLAGLLMWLPAGLLYLASSVWALRSLFARQVEARH